MRQRHPDKEIEKTLREAERHGWQVVTSGKGYPKLRCPCPLKHYRSVHLTPSDANYRRNLEAWLKRQPCWGPE